MALARRTLAELGRAIGSKHSHAEVGALFYELGLEHLDPHGNLLTRGIGVVQALEKTRDQAELEKAALELAERVLAMPGPPLTALAENLQIEGYQYANGRLVPTTPAPAALGPELSLLEQQLDRRGFTTAATHYRQAVDNFVKQNWESCNSQIRSFVEDLVLSIGEHVTKNKRSDPNAGLQDLQSSGHLDHAEFNQFRAFWAGIQDNGPHRGLSHEAEALFRLHASTILGRYLLAKCAA